MTLADVILSLGGNLLCAFLSHIVINTLDSENES
jgi:hypothetical protein